MVEKVMPLAYCCFPLCILLLFLAFICCCLLSYGLSVAQWLSGAVVQCWELFCLTLLVVSALFVIVVVVLIAFVAVFLPKPEGNEQK